MVFSNQSPPRSPSENEIVELSLEDLVNVEITSVSRKAQLQSDAAAAIFVISNDDIKRSGVTNIPDALRMVPGLNVARLESNKWAISSRGFNDRFSNKLLVLIDGRSVYSPTFSGVYWEVQDTLLEDIERIEVIRGPGATLWGANAVNGVINIITKHAADTQGRFVTVGGGTEEEVFGGARYGTSLGEGTYGRVYFKGFKRDSFVESSGNNAHDDWDSLRGGFRMDSQPSIEDSLTIQGDIYGGDINQKVDLPQLDAPFLQTHQGESNVSGGNIVSRWQHTLSPTSDYTLQLYYDRTDRKDIFIREVRNTLDLDFQFSYSAIQRHDVIWGLGYRYTHDRFSRLVSVITNPDSRNDQLFSGFLQDEITLMENKLWLTLGSKFEHNDYSGFEIQPNARLLWTPDPHHKFWGAVSRAVRTPSRFEHDFQVRAQVTPPFSTSNATPFPIEVRLQGSSDYDSEKLISYDVGYRFIPSQSLSVDITGFFSNYHKLRNNKLTSPSFQGTHLLVEPRFTNQWKAKTYGIEVASIWQPVEWNRLDLAYSYLSMKVDTGNEEGAQVPLSPKHQVSLRSAFDLSHDINLDFWFRYISESSGLNSRGLTEFKIDSYFTLDMRVAWRPYDNFELSLVGQNLLDSQHKEFQQSLFTGSSEVERGIYGKLSWHF